MRPREDWADLKHHERGNHAHIVPFGQPYALCGGYPLGLKGWFGTGDMDEYERAAQMPLCEKCLSLSHD